ncbi:hypothetical protein ALP26_103319 [Pseudomonas savastanoi pv. glycinea]|uniref:Uncharacterized protein n=2 Tax=Pseudomonas savastanoi TaxID=29438 RepID=A0A0P9RL02_PSESG|nr:hypothetical protein ALO37_102559 [Pseudomonas savastanoi pv. glycinea]KPY15667.1 hypothetical protein ALO55_102711 [Pseudomonas savastanoi pv. phaseolicola]MBN4173117.1 hypothetical protein [Pseudomonas savastanoi pv. phaseolicola]MBN4179632.1 hypothetical protein [Pseudomonas savastanoi pv. phaseolicola]RML30985.1 hypothetical protein ALQ97_102848 [Pseudomonas savastanoi pv. glycinea]
MGNGENNSLETGGHVNKTQSVVDMLFIYAK